MEITEKQRRFIHEYLLDYNATRAAIRAGYSEDTAYSQGQRLLKNVEIRNALELANKRKADELNITRNRILQELAVIAFSDIDDYNINELNKVELDAHAPKNAKRAIGSVKRRKTTIRTKNDEEIETVEVEYKLWDKIKALGKLGDHLQLFKSNELDNSKEESALDKLFELLESEEVDDYEAPHA